MKKEKSVRKAEMKAAIKEKLKSLIFPVILLAIIVAGIIVVINYQNAGEEEELIRLNGYEGDSAPIVLENNELKLTMDPTTTQFEVLVKDTGKVWRSNPEDADSDAIALPAEKGNLKSPLMITYSLYTGLTTTFGSYNYSVANSIYEIEATDDAIHVKYSLGDVEREYIIPPVCLESDFLKWIGLMDTTESSMVKEYYKKYDINNLGKRDDKEALLADYPIMETEVIYVLRDSAKKAVLTKMEEYFEKAGYTMEDYARDKELNLAESSSDKPIFNVEMIYRLEGGDMVVDIPLSSLEFKKDYPIYTLTPLPYFGAGSMTDEGYILVPEGGGSIINFNNGKTSQSSYYANVYGWDMALFRDAVVHNTRAYYSVYGVSQGNDSFLCILEEGAPYASVSADISGRFNSYNFVNTAYSICVREKYDVGTIANSDIYVYLTDLPDETLTQRYRFVNSGSYVDMAKEYGKYLQDKYGSYLTLNSDTEAPVSIEIVGAVDKVRQILGMPVSRPLELTTYKEAGEIISELKSEGMNNMSVKLTGWCNGGVNQKILRRAKTISALGSKKDLRGMISSAKDQGVTVYLDGVTHYALDSGLFNGFVSYTDSARFLTKERAELFQYSVVTYAAREAADSYYLLHTDLAMKMADKLADAAKSYDAGISFRDTGEDLSSDYYRKNPTSRQATMELQVELLKELTDDGQKVMINMGNDYAIAYADVITNMDLRGSEYTILDARVPFYQLAIHGYVDYMGESLNLCGNTEEQLLISAEYGAGLSFTLMQESAFTLQKTLYTEYYGADYNAWHDRMLEIYTRYNRELGHTFNQEMTGHERITSELTCTTYADGTKVYVNYAFAETTAPDGTKVPARDYKVVR